MMNTIDRTSQLKHKEHCFRMLSACFYEPQKRLFQEEPILEGLAENMQKVCPDAAEAAIGMNKYFENYSQEALRIAHAKLFVGPFELIAPPYGSVYLDPGGRVMGDSTMKVIEFYEEEGLSKDNDFKELPDHIAVELEFMSYMVFKERAALEREHLTSAKQYADKQDYFVKNFLSPLVLQMCIRMAEGTDNRFYSSLAECLSVFIARI